MATNLNGTLVVETEAGSRGVSTREEAIKVLTSTFYSHQLTHKEMKEFTKVQELANHFHINTDDFNILDNPDEEERNQGYGRIYRYGKNIIN